MSKTDFLKVESSTTLILSSVTLLLLYFFVIAFWFEVSNKWLFGILMIGQLYFLQQGIAYMHSIWRIPNKTLAVDSSFQPSVDVFITVCGEPVELIRKTVLAAQAMPYERKKIFILNDGKVAGSANWQAVEQLAVATGALCITRSISGGAKAGNINNALNQTTAEIIIVLDADHIPKPYLLKELVRPFQDSAIGFVQSPQYYYNQKQNIITAAAWAQQQLFFGVINRGRSRFSGNTMCGTNMAIRRDVLDQVGGVDETNIAEDFLTGLRIHSLGYTSYYVPKILAEGLSPEDYSSYYRQQLRWAKGNLEVLLKFNPLLQPGLSFPQRISYFSSCTYYLIGLVVFLNALLPLAFFFTGSVPFTTNSMVLAAAFLPFIFFTFYNLQQSSNYTYTYQAIAFSLGTFSITLQALVETLIGKKRSFAVTSKVQLHGNYPLLVIMQICYVCAVLLGVLYNAYTYGLSPALITNTVWAGFYVMCFSTVIHAAIPRLSFILTFFTKPLHFSSYAVLFKRTNQI
jgi:cellulose synthase (UDP-forming)